MNIECKTLHERRLKRSELDSSKEDHQTIRPRSKTRAAYYPSITAARVVQVNPMAIPIHGVWPNDPSLRTWWVLVPRAPPRLFNRMNRVDGSAGTFVAITSAASAASAMGSGSVFASIATCASWLSSSVDLDPDCSAGSGVGGVTFGRDGVALRADGTCCASAANAAGRKARRMLESFIALAGGRGSWKIRFGDTG